VAGRLFERFWRAPEALLAQVQEDGKIPSHIPAGGLLSLIMANPDFARQLVRT
jgi:hypothetical protein